MPPHPIHTGPGSEGWLCGRKLSLSGVAALAPTSRAHPPSQWNPAGNTDGTGGQKNGLGLAKRGGVIMFHPLSHQSSPHYGRMLSSFFRLFFKQSSTSPTQEHHPEGNSPGQTGVLLNHQKGGPVGLPQNVSSSGTQGVFLSLAYRGWSRQTIIPERASFSKRGPNMSPKTKARGKIAPVEPKGRPFFAS